MTTPAGTDTKSVRISGLPAVARLRRLMLDDGPGVLLTTPERLGLYRAGHVFGPSLSINPGLSDWAARAEKAAVDIGHALKPFPADPGRFSLSFSVGASWPRAVLLERLEESGYERDGDPGYTVLGDTVTILDGDSELRLGFFGDELEELSRNGQSVTGFELGPVAGAELPEDAEPFE